MSTFTGVPPAWTQLAEELTSNYQEVLTPDTESGWILQEHVLRAQSELLKGLLAVVERQIKQAERHSRTQVREKITLS
jgi:outer membrane lipopolysaccharide assembly protein LptE/RlpB